MLRTSSERNLLLLTTACAVLSGCGADEIVSPGSGGNITINNPAPAPAPAPTPAPAPSLVTAAAGCPTIETPAGLADRGTITGPTGTWRVCELPARFTTSTTLTKVPGLLYSMAGRVDVGTDQGAVPVSGEPSVTLTIQPGVIIYGGTGVSWLAVNRGNRINAVGTATRPIVFTSRDNVLGLTTDDSQGQWGGVVLLGRAPVTDCTVAPAAPPGSATCERDTEGAATPAYFGGATPTDNSGTMRYVQIRYSGYVLSGNSELQSLTLGGVGSGTTLEYIHSHNSSDDGFENFGGRVSLRRFVVTGADDDNVDVDTGWKGTIQYLIAVQKTTGAADSMIELDSTNTLEQQAPRTHLQLANFTFVHKNQAAGNQAAMLFRGGADATLINGVVVSPTACLRMVGGTSPAVSVLAPADGPTDKIGPPVFRSVSMSCGGATAFIGSTGLTNQNVADAFAAGTTTNTSTLTPSLTNVFVNGATEAALPVTDAKAIDSRFDTTTYVGAVQNAADTWYAGWTCNSATAGFGTTSSACTSLPTN